MAAGPAFLSMVRSAGRRSCDQTLLLQLRGGRCRKLLHQLVHILRVGGSALPAPHELVLLERIDEGLDHDDGVGAALAAHRPVTRTPAMAIVATVVTRIPRPCRPHRS